MARKNDQTMRTLGSLEDLNFRYTTEAAPETAETPQGEKQNYVKQKTRKPASQQTGKPESQKAVKQKAVEPPSSLTGNAVTRKTRKRIAVKQKYGRHQMIKWIDAEKLVTVATKAPENVADFWATEAKRLRLPMAFVISNALIEAFGLPDGAILEDENE
ncbi:MAG: hypothetical protein MOB07_31150 [Acidobacteria bacterium]|nr:hypothetical protein [Acidobacteriota bacterium]